jgi:disulfide bond formation protein DsbB
MAPTDEKTEVVLPAEVPEDLLLPLRSKSHIPWRSIRPCGAGGSLRRERLLPLVFAIVLKLLLQPALRILEGLHIPRTIASLLLILALLGTIVGLGTVISGPARTWAAKLPEGIPRLQERLSFMREPIDTLQRFLQQVEDFGGTEPSPNAAPLTQGSYSLGSGILRAASLRRCCFFSFFSCPAISSCTASSRYCRALGVSAKS